MARASKKIHVSASARPSGPRRGGAVAEPVAKPPVPDAAAGARPTAHYLEQKQLSGKVVRLNLSSLRLDVYRPAYAGAAAAV